MKFEDIHKVYFIGIGGIGMSALARYFKFLGKSVAGYDKTRTLLTQTLEEEGIVITYQDAVGTLPDNLSPEDTIIVYTPAVPVNHNQKKYLIEQNFTLYKRSEILGMITKNTCCLAIAGTHGKTTTTALLGHILFQNKVPATTFMGGIAENYDSNLLLAGETYSVVEADEFDRSFLQLFPTYAAITSMDADHLDIYKEHTFLNESFQAFAQKLPTEGKLITRKGLPIQGITYAVEEEADYTATNIRIEEGCFVYDLWHEGELHRDFSLQLPGRHNIENALAATALAMQVGLSMASIRKAIVSFKGIKRRFSVHHQNPVYIDDYAHHPTELDAVLSATRELFPNKRILGVFQPHLFSRTRDFAEAFAESLTKLDTLILIDIYPAREMPIEGISSDWLLEKIALKDKVCVSLPEALSEIESQSFDVLITLGAGDIDTLVNPIKQWLSIR